MNKEEIKKFVKQWIECDEDDMFIKDECGMLMYSSGPITLNLTYFFETILQDYEEQKDSTIEWVEEGRKLHSDCNVYEIINNGNNCLLHYNDELYPVHLKSLESAKEIAEIIKKDKK